MQSEQSHHRPVIIAAVAAGCLMLVFGLTYRVLAAHMWLPVEKPPVDPAALERLPLQIGEWTGRDISVDPRVMRAAGVDAQVNRRYVRSSGAESVSLYIGCGVRAVDVLVHNPPACYIVAGWSVVERHAGELVWDDGTTLPYTILELSRGTLDRSGMILLHWIVLDQECFRDMHAVRQAVRPGFRTVDYAATVQILAAVEGLSPRGATKLVKTFAADTAPVIAQLFNDLQSDRREAEARKSIGTE